MPRSPRDSHTHGQGTEPKTPRRPVSKVVRIPPPQLFRCPRCSATSFQVLFHARDVAGFCAECYLWLRTDKTIGRRTPEYYGEFTRQVEASYPDRVQRVFLKMNSVSEAKRAYPLVRRLGFRTKQSSPMLHARLVMVETTRDQAVVLIEKLREQGMQVALQDDLILPHPRHALSAELIQKA